ncbi:ribose ABC transporter [Streptomyces sp. Mg1]|nr:ribose ABC transporter [Streptomyces sp. Mg1]
MHDAHDPSDTSTSGPPSRSGGEPLVRVSGLGKRFGGTVALDGVSLDLHRGSVLALLGPNGAGKPTLIKVLAGVYRADEGEVTVAGHLLGSEAALAKMSFIHQDLGLVGWMTVAENIALGTGYPRHHGLAADPGALLQGARDRRWTPGRRCPDRGPRTRRALSGGRRPGPRAPGGGPRHGRVDRHAVRCGLCPALRRPAHPARRPPGQRRAARRVRARPPGP